MSGVFQSTCRISLKWRFREELEATSCGPLAAPLRQRPREGRDRLPLLFPSIAPELADLPTPVPRSSFALLQTDAVEVPLIEAAPLSEMEVGSGHSAQEREQEMVGVGGFEPPTYSSQSLLAPRATARDDSPCADSHLEVIPNLGGCLSLQDAAATARTLLSLLRASGPIPPLAASALSVLDAALGLPQAIQRTETRLQPPESAGDPS